MQTVTVPLSTHYEVKIGAGLLSTLGAEAAALLHGRRAVIVSDSNVWPLYGTVCERSLESAGFCVDCFVFPAGEGSKSPETYLALTALLAQKGLGRKDCLIALGGGVTGDLCGFAAATYLRGIPYLQVPTTLLAMVDSSVGGKTAIDLPAGKNLLGAFYQPRLVLCDTDCLATLPPRVFSDGCGEVIKYAMLFDEEMFRCLERDGLQFCTEAIIARCIALKRDIVTQDEFDTGSRVLLNFGHTLGHAIEQCTDYRLSHGSAVAIGMAVFTRATGNRTLAARLEALLHRFGLPTETQLPVQALVQQIMADKKRNGDRITLILPATVGCAELKTVPISQLHLFIKAGM